MWQRFGSDPEDAAPAAGDEQRSNEQRSEAPAREDQGERADGATPAEGRPGEAAKPAPGTDNSSGGSTGLWAPDMKATPVVDTPAKNRP